MTRRTLWSGLAWTLLYASWLSGCASEDDFECEACKDDTNCTKTDPSDSSRYSTSVTECPTGICYVMFGSLIGHSKWSGAKTEEPLVSLGCSKVRDADVPRWDKPPFPAPPYAPLPPPEHKPGIGQYVCRRNGAPYQNAEVSTETSIASSVSCFCYTPRCQREMRLLATSGSFQASLTRALPVEGTGWVIVDQRGALQSETDIKKYDPLKPDVDLPVKFSCGQCPCEVQEDCPRIGRHNCTREGPALYTVETPCETEHCYLTFGIMEVQEARWEGWRVGNTKWWPDPYTARGCGHATDQEWDSAKKAAGNPLFYAWPPPEPVPSAGQWACRRNPPHEHYVTTVTCFCFASMCQAGYNPKFEEFRNNVLSNIPLGNYWVIVDEEGRKTEARSMYGTVAAFLGHLRSLPKMKSR